MIIFNDYRSKLLTATLDHLAIRDILSTKNLSSDLKAVGGKLTLSSISQGV